MTGACALAIIDDLPFEIAPAAPRLALGGGFAGDPPPPRGPAEILPFPVPRVRPEGDGVRDDNLSEGEEGLLADDALDRPALDPDYWRHWMARIFERHPCSILSA
jgi:hypothetical protein